MTSEVISRLQHTYLGFQILEYDYTESLHNTGCSLKVKYIHKVRPEFFISSTAACFLVKNFREFVGSAKNSELQSLPGLELPRTNHDVYYFQVHLIIVLCNQVLLFEPAVCVWSDSWSEKNTVFMWNYFEVHIMLS